MENVAFIISHSRENHPKNTIQENIGVVLSEFFCELKILAKEIKDMTKIWKLQVY